MVDLDKPMKLAEKAVAGSRSYATLNTLGAIAYRAGRFDEAIKHLQESMKLHGKGGTAWDWLFLGMAHHRRGRREGGPNAGSKAAAWMDQASSGRLPDPAQFHALRWDQRLELQLLRQQATALMLKPQE